MPYHSLPAKSKFFKGKRYQQMLTDLHLTDKAEANTRKLINQISVRKSFKPNK